MVADLIDQPNVWRDILARRRDADALGRIIAARAPGFVLLAARGTSDHAALYAKYLVEIVLGLPAGLVSPSVITAYGAQPRWAGGLFVAVSQSGASPDLVRTVETARRQGALTLAVTNDPGSDLAAAAELHLAISAGPEAAVAATKSYTAQLLSLFLLMEAWAGRPADGADRLPDLADAMLAPAGDAMAKAAERYRFAQRLVVTGRGYAYPTAREAALKLMETSYVAAQAFSGADLLHGPVAMLDTAVPVLAVAPEGVAGQALRPVLERVRAAGSDLFVVGSPDALGVDRGYALPSGVPEALSPLIEIIPFQWLALHMAVARGEDPDAPRGLRKVTRTL